MRLFIAAWAVILIIAISQTAAQNITLNEIIDIAVEANPKLKSQRAKINISGTKIDQSTNIPDPQIILGLSNMPLNSFSFTQEPMTGKVIGISQSFPFPGRLGTNEEVLKSDTRIEFERLRESNNKLIADIVGTYHELQFKRESKKISLKNIKLLEGIRKVATQKYIVSETGQQSLINIEAEIASLEDEIIMIEADEIELLSRLNGYMYRDLFDTLLTKPIEPIEPADVSERQLDSLARLNNPLLSELSARIEKARLSGSLADYESYPNFNITAQYSQRDYIAATNTDLTDLVSFFVSFNLPLNYGGKNSALSEEAVLTESLFKEEYESYRLNLRIYFGKALSRLNNLVRREKLLTESIIPLVKRSFDAALAEYESGMIDLIDVIKAERDILKQELELAKVRTDYNLELTQLEYLTGADLSGSNYFKEGEEENEE
jgi:cobalt-zinc-cadmium efflux system outer membrane protein